jgi:membrane protein implicated in regulation of membrane protease activity
MEGKKSTLHQDWWRGRAEVVVSGRTWRARTQGGAGKKRVFFVFTSLFFLE